MINRITIKKAVEYTGLSASWFRKHIKSGTLAVYKMPHDSRILINPKDIEALTPPAKIELNVNNPVNYLMKYILKTLDDLREDSDNLTALSLWYVYHGISRFYTSRTFASLEVYRKLHGKYTLRNLTTAINEDRVQVWRDTTTNAIAHIENDFGSLYVPKPILSRFSDHKWRDDIDADEHSYFNYEFEPIKFAEVQKQRFIDIVIDGEEFILINGSLSKFKKQPHEMGNLELYNYFYSLDLYTANIDHYRVTHKLMCERGLIVNQLENILHVENSLRYFSAWDEKLIDRIYAEKVF